VELRRRPSSHSRRSVRLYRTHRALILRKGGPPPITRQAWRVLGEKVKKLEACFSVRRTGCQSLLGPGADDLGKSSATRREALAEAMEKLDGFLQKKLALVRVGGSEGRGSHRFVPNQEDRATVPRSVPYRWVATLP